MVNWHKNLVVFFLLLIPSVCFAGGMIVNPFWIGGGAGDSCTDGLILSWHCEDATVTNGTPAGCGSEDSTAELGSGAAIDTDSTPTPVDGSGTLYLDGTYSSAKFSSITSDLVTEGKVTGYLNPASFISEYFFYARIDINNFVLLRLIDGYGDARLRLQHYGGGTSHSTEISDGSGQTTVTSGDWFYFEAEWKANTTGNDVYLKICDSDGANCVTHEADVDLASPTGSMDYVEWGYSPGSQMFSGHMDALEVYNDSQY